MSNIASDITGLIGNTLLVRLNKIAQGLGAEMVAKLESYNPLSNVKDGIGISMIKVAEDAGTMARGLAKEEKGYWREYPLVQPCGQLWRSLGGQRTKGKLIVVVLPDTGVSATCPPGFSGNKDKRCKEVLTCLRP